MIAFKYIQVCLTLPPNGTCVEPVMRTSCLGALVILGLLSLGACAPRETEEQRRQEANTPAGKLGQVAHKAAVEVDKAGRVIGRQLDKAAHDAREGWKEDARKDTGKK